MKEGTRSLIVARVARGLPLWVAAVLLCCVDRRGVLLAAPGVLTLLVQVAGGRLRLGRFGEVVLLLLAAGLSVPLLNLLGPDSDEGHLPTLWCGVAGATLFCGALRLLLAEPAGGTRWTYVLGVLGVAACGETNLGLAYAIAAFAYLLLALLALRAEDPTRTSWPELPRRDRVLLLVLPLVATLLAGVVVAPLVPLHALVLRRIDLSYLAGASRARGRFTDRFRLGSLRDVLDSDEIVLRVFSEGSEKVDYLRGAVYDHYESGRWRATQRGRPARVAAGRGRPKGADVIEVRRVSGDPERLFVPLGLSELATDGGVVLSDSLSTLHAEPGGARFWLREGPRKVAPLVPPGPEDVQLPPALRKPLVALADEWTAGQQSDAGKLAALVRRLSGGYAYSLNFQRRGATDPVLEFLLSQKQGHCEYFASALALLARAAGVPARVVGGYRVVETSPLGGYQVVRERNAHAWVEAYVPGHGGAAGWATFDATPAGAPPGQERNTARWAAVRDLLGVLWHGLWTWVGARSKTELGAGMGLALLVLLGVRWVQQRRRDGAPAPLDDRLGRPSPSYERLEQALALRGTHRPPCEPLESFADRVDDEEAAALIGRYAALRYGGSGDEASVSAALVRCARRLSAPPG
jgi:transglutaminase-like putative cysteine protease